MSFLIPKERIMLSLEFFGVPALAIQLALFYGLGFLHNSTFHFYELSHNYKYYSQMS